MVPSLMQMDGDLIDSYANYGILFCHFIIGWLASYDAKLYDTTTALTPSLLAFRQLELNGISRSSAKLVSLKLNFLKERNLALTLGPIRVALASMLMLRSLLKERQ